MDLARSARPAEAPNPEPPADYSLQVHGGYGYMAESEIGRVWKDARVKRISAGTDEVQREIIARHLLGKPRSRGRPRLTG